MPLPDLCQDCAERWAKRKLPGKMLVTLARKTVNKGLTVVVCPWCDGPVVQVAALKD